MTSRGDGHRTLYMSCTLLYDSLLSWRSVCTVYNESSYRNPTDNDSCVALLQQLTLKVEHNQHYYVKFHAIVHKY